MNKLLESADSYNDMDMSRAAELWAEQLTIEQLGLEIAIWSIKGMDDTLPATDRREYGQLVFSTIANTQVINAGLGENLESIVETVFNHYDDKAYLDNFISHKEEKCDLWEELYKAAQSEEPQEQSAQVSELPLNAEPEDDINTTSEELPIRGLQEKANGLLEKLRTINSRALIRQTAEYLGLKDQPDSDELPEALPRLSEVERRILANQPYSYELLSLEGLRERALRLLADQTPAQAAQKIAEQNAAEVYAAYLKLSGRHQELDPRRTADGKVMQTDDEALKQLVDPDILAQVTEAEWPNEQPPKSSPIGKLVLRLKDRNEAESGFKQ